jgi:penicillin-binding protein A
MNRYDWKRQIHVWIFALAGLLALIYLMLGLPLRSAREAWREGDYVAAASTLERWQRLRLRPADFEHLLAINYLSMGRDADAAPILQSLRRRDRQWRPLIDKAEVGERLISTARYEQFLAYDQAVEPWRQPPGVRLYRAAALAGSGQIDQAEEEFTHVAPRPETQTAYDSLRRAIDERKRGNYALVLDRNGNTIASWQIDNRDLVTMNQDFRSIIESEAGPFTVESQIERIGIDKPIVTTLDPYVQKAAVYALGGFRGSLVAIDVATNEIVAVANTAGRGELQNLAFGGEFEPGSVMKVFTALHALDSGIPMQEIFPFECRGHLELEGRLFRDWARHDAVPDLNEAMATSCNVAFALMGLRLGSEGLRALMSKLQFDRHADLGLFTVPLGHSLGDVLTQMQMANAGVGLEQMNINTLHLAMLTAAVARGGVMETPRLVRERRTILGQSIEVPAQPLQVRIASEQALPPVIQSMRAVVTNPRGTGRRIDVPQMDLAVKTGTAGQRTPAYNSVMMAIAPAEQPRIAMAMIAEHSGPAEIAGARIVHAFFTQMAARPADAGASGP